MNNSTKAVVKEVNRLRKPKCSFVICIVAGMKETVTFALVRNVWHEKVDPKREDIVCLSEFNRKGGQWRAYNARLWKPSDEPLVKTNLDEQNRKQIAPYGRLARKERY